MDDVTLGEERKHWETPKNVSRQLNLPDKSIKLGIQIRELPNGGWQVKGIDMDSFAKREGVSIGDVILRINNEIPPRDWAILSGQLRQRPLAVEFSDTGIHDDYSLIDLDAECPDAYKCPICFEIMSDPVLLIGDGHTYERDAIEEWISKSKLTVKNPKDIISPMTGMSVNDTTLVPNCNIKKAIDEWFTKYPEQKRDQLQAEDLQAAVKLRELDLEMFVTKDPQEQKGETPQSDQSSVKMISGPSDVATGFISGVGSIVAHAVHTTMEVPAGVTNIIGTGASVMSMDEDYIRDYDQRSSEPPKHIIDGLTNGIVVLGKSIFEGVSGVFVKPVRGAQEDGFAGFAKGLAHGLVGIVAKPLAGATGTVTEVLRGVGNTPNAIANKDYAFKIRGVDSLRQKNEPLLSVEPGAVKPLPVDDQPPPVGDQPPPVGDEPPPVCDEPPLVGGEPPLVGDQPPLVGDEPPLVCGQLCESAEGHSETAEVADESVNKDSK